MALPSCSHPGKNNEADVLTVGPHVAPLGTAVDFGWGPVAPRYKRLEAQPVEHLGAFGCVREGVGVRRRVA